MKNIPLVVRKSVILTLIFALAIICNVGYAQQGRIQVPDSVLKKFSVEDLVRLKKMLEEEKDRLIKRQEEDRQRGVQLSQEFLNQTREENENQDLILIRVAEYYIEEALDEYDTAVEEYDRKYAEYEKQLAAYEAGKLKVEPAPPQFPKKNFERAIGIYDLLLTNFPESELADDALYNKAYLLGDMGEEEASQATFLELIDKYPESSYIPEAYMSLAEYYFQARRGQTRDQTIRNLHKAAQLYKNVLNYKDSPRYDEALYKLGWTYYRLAADNPEYYRDAVVYFTGVVRDIERFKEIDPEGEYIKANIQPEALQYIAACFVDTSFSGDGVVKAKGFLEKLGYPDYGITILEQMGNLYARIVDYDNSIRAYQSVLELYPDYRYAPRIYKNIADVYLEAREFEKAYVAREQLYQNYNPKSEWYAKMEQSDLPDRIAVLDEATRLTEAALRSNIIYQYETAQALEQSKGDSLSAYREFAALSKQYLELFPTHENAYEINWSLAYVLDSELGDYKNAFNEYIRVSNDYLEDAHREDAATNAIYVAQVLVNAERAAGDTAVIGGTDFTQLTTQDFTENEKLLAEAYDNYIKLFPEQEKTASYLAQAGALYYQHRQYDLARKYYKTMVTKFPEAQQRSVGLLSLMNSYFFLGKFLDAEFVAKKIVASEGLPADQVEIARKRIGESIYKNAEKLEQEERYLEAAQEFHRVYTDAPYYKDIVDVALFNSGRNYEKAEEWLKAIAIYDTLVTNFEDSKYRLVALGKIADAYKQLEDYAGVGKTFERIYNLYPNSKDAEAALYNASLFYAKAEAYNDAIRVNNTFIERYPDRPDSKDLLFENAQYYLKLKDLDNANRIYDRFAQTYPGDPRTVEAFYRRGEYYYDNGQIDLAIAEFRKAINKSEEYARVGKDPNLYFASEAYYKLGEIEYDAFKAMKLTYPDATFKAQLKQKQEKLVDVVNAFTKVISMGSLKGFEAMYKIAEAYERFADDIANQEIDPNLPPEQRLVKQNQVFTMSVPAYDRAVEEYENVIKNIPVFAEKLEISLFDTTRQVEMPEMVTPEDSLQIVKKEVLRDSTREVALHWFDRAESKISWILYSVAERSSQFIDAYLRQGPVPEGIMYLSWKKLLLEKAVAPAVLVTLNAHLKNIKFSRQLGLENKYVTESERKILLTRNVLAEQYGELMWRSIDLYNSMLPELKNLIEGGETALTPDGMNSFDYNDQLLTIIDYMNEFQTIAMNQYSLTLQFARENNIVNDALLTTQDRMFNFAFKAGEALFKLARNANTERDAFSQKAAQTGENKYSLGSTFFDDQYTVLTEYALQPLQRAHQLAKDYNVQNVWTTLVLAKLIEVDPATYLGDMPKDVTVITSDPSWLAADTFQVGWNSANFDDAGWKPAEVVQLPLELVFAGFDTLEQAPASIWLYSFKNVPQDTGSMPLQPVADTTISDTGATDTTRSLELEDKEIPDEASLMTATMPAAPVGPDTLTAYFRKVFELTSRIVNGWGLITADDSYHLYLNGEYIRGDGTNDFESVEKIEFYEISDFLKTGKNVLAVDVTDFDGEPRYGFRFYLHLESLPVEVTKAAEKIRSQIESGVDENEYRKVVTLNKNKIVKP
ncbi:MAG: hypothetical protein Kow0037_05080 [Calditrichia bacterium]